MKKNLIVAVARHPITTAFRALIFPLALVLIVTYAQYFFNPPQHFGIGAATPVLSLSEGLSRSSPVRPNVVFVYNGTADGDTSAIIESLRPTIEKAGKKVITATSESALQTICRSSQNGASGCYAAAVFHTSPTEPRQGGFWNYTLRADTALGNGFDVRKPNNDAQIYLLPFQTAIDNAITTRTPGYSGPDLSRGIDQYPFTFETEEVRISDTRMSYLNAGIAYFGVVFSLGMVGVVYHMTGMIAYEREAGLSQIIETMMPNVARWQPRMVRLLSYHSAFTMIYFPSWLAIGIILYVKVFTLTAPAITIVYHLLCGLALCSYSMVGAVLFKRAQLSGISMTVIAVVLAVIPQVLDDKKQTQATVVALSLLFPTANYTYFITFVSRWELTNMGAKLSHTAPESPWALHGKWLWVFLLIQIVLYPILAFFLERLFFSTASSGRRLRAREVASSLTVRLQNFSKTYRQNWISALFLKERPDVEAVKGLNLDARKGQILMLLGPNGSGKSTTLDAIAGLNKVTGGYIELDGSGGLGVAPQKNVLWDVLTVQEHIDIFYKLKSPASRNTRAELASLMHACDISKKARAKTKTLSGGQKRKVQLAMMFAGGSAVCCVDEVSSGLDPLSRRKVWDILLAQRSSRTIIMTTHFLDEADFLSDHIAILSKGTLKAEGSSAELKQLHGNGYTIEATRHDRNGGLNAIGDDRFEDGMHRKTFSAKDATHATELIDALDRNGIDDYRVSGPTLEDVFLKLAGSPITGPTPSQNASQTTTPPAGITEKYQEEGAKLAETPGVSLHEGRHISGLKQSRVLFVKRMMVFRRKWGPHLSALIVALIGAGVSPLFLKWMRPLRCSVSNDSPGLLYQSPYSEISQSLRSTYDRNMVGGPPSQHYDQGITNLAHIYGPEFAPFHGSSSIKNASQLQQTIHMVNSLQDFNAYVANNLQSVHPGGVWSGDASSPPTFAWSAEALQIAQPVIMNNFMNALLSNISISTGYSNFDIPPEPILYSFAALLFAIYFSLVFSLYPAFYALYPTIERLRQARALQYSNGIRAAPMWLAYLAFDFSHVLIISVISIGLLSTARTTWFHLPYMFIILLLYGTSSTLLSYIISLFARSQLAAWALCTSGQVVMCLAYLGAYLGVQTSVDVADLHATLDKIQYSIGLFSPIANVTRAIYVSLNQFLLDCGRQSTPGSMEQYGGPILYLIIQCFVFFGILFLWDSGWSVRSLSRKPLKEGDLEDMDSTSKELARVQKASTGLRVIHLSKSFGRNKAVDDISFGVEKSEVFTLLGPNGAGKCKRPPYRLP